MLYATTTDGDRAVLHHDHAHGTYHHPRSGLHYTLDPHPHDLPQKHRMPPHVEALLHDRLSTTPRLVERRLQPTTPQADLKRSPLRYYELHTDGRIPTRCLNLNLLLKETFKHLLPSGSTVRTFEHPPLKVIMWVTDSVNEGVVLGAFSGHPTLLPLAWAGINWEATIKPRASHTRRKSK